MNMPGLSLQYSLPSLEFVEHEGCRYSHTHNTYVHVLKSVTDCSASAEVNANG